MRKVCEGEIQSKFTAEPDNVCVTDFIAIFFHVLRRRPPRFLPMVAVTRRLCNRTFSIPQKRVQW